VVLWILTGIWGALMIFGVISLIGPSWLKSVGQAGRVTEVRGYTNSGDAFARGGDYQHALERYEIAMKIDPTYLPARINAAAVYGQLGRDLDGIGLLRDALNRKVGQRGVVLYNLAELYRHRGEATVALATYREALAAGGRPDLIHARIGELLAAGGDAAGARDALQQAIRAWEDPATHYRTMLLTARDNPEADSTSVRAIDAVLARGVSETDVARFDLEYVRAQNEKDPELARLYARLGLIEAPLGESAAAKEHLSRSLQIWPANPQAGEIRGALTKLTGSGSGAVGGP
jgi:tetratricopeptide (TPR) repeat protein